MGAPMGRLRTTLWGLGLAAAGAVVALGLLPGASTWSPGPRAGVATLLIVLGTLLLGSLALPWVTRRTARPENAGGCPVGATCACGHFNLKPRRACRACGQPTSFAPAP